MVGGFNDFRGVSKTLSLMSLSLRSISSIKFIKFVFVVNGDLIISGLSSHEASLVMPSKSCKLWAFTCGAEKPGL